jgi:hypothetical protein
VEDLILLAVGVPQKTMMGEGLQQPVVERGGPAGSVADGGTAVAHHASAARQLELLEGGEVAVGETSEAGERGNDARDLVLEEGSAAFLGASEGRKLVRGDGVEQRVGVGGGDERIDGVVRRSRVGALQRGSMLGSSVEALGRTNLSGSSGGSMANSALAAASSSPKNPPQLSATMDGAAQYCSDEYSPPLKPPPQLSAMTVVPTTTIGVRTEMTGEASCAVNNLGRRRSQRASKSSNSLPIAPRMSFVSSDMSMRRS